MSVPFEIAGVFRSVGISLILPSKPEPIHCSARKLMKIVKQNCRSSLHPIAFALFIACIAHSACVGISETSETPVSPSIAGEGRIEVLHVGDELAGWGRAWDFDYRLMRLERDVAYVQTKGGRSEVRGVRAGDILSVTTSNGTIDAEVRRVTEVSLIVFVPEEPWIVDPPEGDGDEEDLPVAASVSGKPGMVVSPYTGKKVDASDCAVGSIVFDPTTENSVGDMKKFRVPRWGTNKPNKPLQATR